MLQILRMLTAWGLVGFAIVQVGRMFVVGTAQVKRMHQIPCPSCRYFSGNYSLKCALHPHRACSEAAIGCGDFEA